MGRRVARCGALRFVLGSSWNSRCRWGGSCAPPRRGFCENPSESRTRPRDEGVPPRHAALLSNAGAGFAAVNATRRHASSQHMLLPIVDGAGLGPCHVQDLPKILHPVGRGRGGKTCRTLRRAAPRTWFFVELKVSMGRVLCPATSRILRKSVGHAHLFHLMK